MKIRQATSAAISTAVSVADVMFTGRLLGARKSQVEEENRRRMFGVTNMVDGGWMLGGSLF